MSWSETEMRDTHHGDGGVATHEQQCRRHAHNVGAPNYYRIFARDIHARALEELDAALGRARHVHGIATALRQEAHVERVEAVHVLLIVDLHPPPR